MNVCIVTEKKNIQKEWHKATKSLKSYLPKFLWQIKPVSQKILKVLAISDIFKDKFWPLNRSKQKNI
jgi:hypothetical protein